MPEIDAFSVNYGCRNIGQRLMASRLLFLLIEAIVRRPLPRRFEGWITAAGFVILMGFMVLVTFSDILRLVTGKGLGG